MNDTTKRSLIAMIISAVSVSLSWLGVTGWVGFVFCIIGIVLGFISLIMVKNLKNRAAGNPAKTFIKIASILSLIGIALGALMFLIGLIVNIVRSV